MLTRLKVSGFKNLVDVDVRFGPFTCIAGANGVGKSNLFDAILFLSSLTERTLAEAALSVRDDSRRTGDIRGIFHRIGSEYDREMRFEAEMILPKHGLDDLGQHVDASITLARYVLRLGLRDLESSHADTGPLEVLEETLVPMRLRDASEHILFPVKKEWRESVLIGRRTSDFISTEPQDGQAIVRMHQDGRQGGLLTRPASMLPRTMLSTVQTGEYPTALLVRREMQSWRLLQLEGSALRRPDEFTASPRMGSDGSHMAATLHQLARKPSGNGNNEEAKSGAVYAQVANRLAELLEDVREITIDRDEARERFTLYIKTRDGTLHPARDLSDGTLRFLALTVMEFDRQSGGLLCLEEPENGIHPRRIPVMLQLLQDMATDTDEPCDEANPLRQVIVNTHSPTVFQLVPEESLLLAELVEEIQKPAEPEGNKVIRYSKLQFSCLEDTWRAKKIRNHRITGKGNLLAYLNPSASERQNRTSRRRVMDRSDVQQLLMNMPAEG